MTSEHRGSIRGAPIGIWGAPSGILDALSSIRGALAGILRPQMASGAPAKINVKGRNKTRRYIIPVCRNHLGSELFLPVGIFRSVGLSRNCLN